MSSAGDVNGDGLADLIVGAKGALADAGKSYVIFGGQQFATTIDFMGSSANDSQTGTSASETFVGGGGNDTITGNGGADVMYGGAGNDTFVLNAANISKLSSAYSASDSQLARIDGGSGMDTIQLTGGAALNLTAIANQSAGTPDVSSRISSIEKIDMATDAAANTLTLGLKDVLDLTSMNQLNSTTKAGMGWTGGTYNFAAIESRHQLVITGTALDSVVTSGGFADTGQTAIMNGHTYEVYNQGSYAQLLIDMSVVRSGVL